MKNYHYPDKASIENIDSVLTLSAKVLDTDEVVFKDKTIVSPLVGAALSGGLATGGLAGAAGIAGGSAAGGAAIVGGGVVLKGVAATGAAAAGLSSVAVVAAVAAPVAVIGCVFYFVFKSRKHKKLFNMKLARYTEAIKSQNKTIARLYELDKKREQDEKKLNQENSELRSKINELRAINESLVVIIGNLQKDLELDEAA